MLTFFRNFFKSKLGLAITFAFIALIALAFASSDVAGTGTFGGVAGGNRVAVVGDEKIGTAELSAATTRAFEQVREQQPTLTLAQFAEQGVYEEVIEQLIDRYAIGEFAESIGLRAGANLVNSEIIAIPAFRGADGNFSQDAYQGVLRQQGLSDAEVRRDFAAGLLAQQLLTPIEIGSVLPDRIAKRYAALLKERREGAIAFLPSASFAPKDDPSDAQLKKYYDDNRARFVRPERRVIRYASFGADSVEGRIEPTSAEIAARYERDKAQYAAKETRTISQFVVPTEAAANAIRERVNAGGSFQAAAREAGFNVSTSEAVSKQEVQQASSAAVANAVFAAARGQVAEPQRAALGWYVARVDAIQQTPAQSLTQATPQITEQLRVEKRAAAIADLSAEIEDQLEEGGSLSSVAEELGLTVQTTPPLLADGRVYQSPQQQVPETLLPVIDTAFQMDEGEPQLAEVLRGQIYMVYEVSDITPSATAPLAEIRQQAVAGWRLSEGARLSRAATDRVMERLAKGEAGSLAAAMDAEATDLPRVDEVDLNRQQIVSQEGRVPPPLALMFSMAEGTTKRLEANNDLGWFVIDLKDISTDPVADDDPLLAATKQQLSGALASEYLDQLVLAMRGDLGVERNEAAIDAVRKQLVGER